MFLNFKHMLMTIIYTSKLLKVRLIMQHADILTNSSIIGAIRVSSHLSQCMMQTENHDFVIEISVHSFKLMTTMFSKQQSTKSFTVCKSFTSLN